MLQCFIILSVCIVNWNTKDELGECLTALQIFPFTGGAQEIIVVDNASADGAAAMVRRQFPTVRLIANPANEIYARGTNQALAAAQGDLILLLNPDVRVTAGALDTLTAELARHPRAAAVAPRLVFEDGATQNTIRGFPTPVALLADIFGLARLFSKNRRLAAYRQTFFDYDHAGDAPQPMTSCLLIARDALNNIGTMDERFPLFFNDVDWCWRAWRDGFVIRYTPDAVAVHRGGGGASTRQVRTAAIWESHRALLRFYAKHYRRRVPYPWYQLIQWLVIIGAWARTGRWGRSLGRDGGETTPEDLHRELERAR